MSDIGLFLKDNGNFGQLIDLAKANGDLVLDEGLRTAVMVSLFTDARAEASEVAPSLDRRGWWGDALSDIEGDVTGSKLWLLERQKQTNETRVRAEEYASEALQWLVDDGVAESVAVTATFPAPKSLLLEISITRPNGEKVNYTFDNAWKAEELR